MNYFNSNVERIRVIFLKKNLAAFGLYSDNFLHIITNKIFSNSHST
jgi:hypothetical protein